MSGTAAGGVAADVADRVWARDETLWGEPGAPELGDRLGWLTIAERMSARVGELERWCAGMHAGGLSGTLLLGMGGSSLGPAVLGQAFGRPLGMLDSTDPAAVRAALDPAALARTIFVVASKSGGTIETLSHFKHFFALAAAHDDDPGARFAAVTDPGSPLAELAAERGFRKVWLADPEIGGRYSVLSHFGLVPAALAGVPVGDVLATAVSEADACRRAGDSPGAALGVALGEHALAGRDKLTLIVDPPLASLGLWAEQLIAESTGKQGKGILPVADEPLPPPAAAGEAYGDDRVFLHVVNDRAPHAPNAAVAGAIAAAGHPLLRIAAAGPEDLGRLFFRLEFATAVAGHVLGINPFDQPDVQEAKDATKRVLAAGAAEPPFEDAAAALELIAGVAPPGYVAIHGYLAPDPAFDAAVAELRAAIRARTRATTTFGYGPRFLHSTGQLHKGGPPTGVFIQLVHDAGADVAIPGEPYGFAALKRAQAAGDHAALRARGRPVARLELTGDPAAAVRALAARV